MKKIGMLKGIRLCRKYSSLDEAARSAVREKRLRDMVDHARAHSPYYAKLYSKLGDKFSLRDIPPVNKRELMAHFDEWIADGAATLADAQRFMESPDNIGRKMFGKYMVFTTSGSTGEPLVLLCDDTTNNMMGAINTLRTFARESDFREFIKRGGRTIGVFATGGFYLGNSSVRARLLQMPWKKSKIGVTSALLPIPDIVRDINALKPAMLGGYPTILEMLIDEAEAGRLTISPTLIMTGGEYLSDDVRDRLSRTFSCHVQTSYSCTEGGTIACECTQKHFHINDDWLIVEPVDKDNRPVPDGTLADKILLTNLFNFTQPMIRYEVTDRVIMSHEPCPCGNSSPWLTLEGRTDDVLTLRAHGGTVKIAPLAIYASIKETHAVRRFQLIAKRDGTLEMRVTPADGITVEAAFERAVAAFSSLAVSHGADAPKVALSPDAPQRQSGSGKFKHIIAE